MYSRFKYSQLMLKIPRQVYHLRHVQTQIMGL